jgi:hypothetical protein
MNYLLLINHNLVSIQEETYVCCFTSDELLIVFCPVLLVDRRREVVDKQRPMSATEKVLDVVGESGRRVTLTLVGKSRSLTAPYDGRSLPADSFTTVQPSVDRPLTS